LALQDEDLPAIPPSLVQEYLTYGGGAFGQTTYNGEDYDTGDAKFVPRSYFEEMANAK